MSDNPTILIPSDTTGESGIVTKAPITSVPPPAALNKKIGEQAPLVLQSPDSGHESSGQTTTFICGVVEGFYGRPWTTEQRKDLFKKLKRWGLDSYVYAPKDDYKHRAYWRELYTVEEGDHLASLITAAKEYGIVFYYALSPGLDMTYSNPKEVAALKRKLEQVGQFGCEAFALLFDDIEPEMSKADKEVFQTFAHAQVTVTNEIYTHLRCSKFLFCPTQYCSTRAVPSVTNSEYLTTLGNKLAHDINILWTGSKVISKQLTIDSIQEITEVLRRPPVIWDNLHANDYDQKRVFLGPYSGRTPELIPLLRGVLTNPNCEFHANAVAIHTLAHWSKCSSDTKINNSISADIKLETENEDGAFGEDVPAYLSKNVYHPRVALKQAILDWLPEFFIVKEAYGPISKPHPAVTMVMPVIPILPSVNTCMSLTTSTPTSTTTSTLKVPEVNTTQLQALAEVCSVVTGSDGITLPNMVMNSLVSSTKIVTNETLPHPIVPTVNSISLPNVSVPVSSISIPIMNMNGPEFPRSVESSSQEIIKLKSPIDDHKSFEHKKLDEPMPPAEGDEDQIKSIEVNIMNTDSELSVKTITDTKNSIEVDPQVLKDRLNGCEDNIMSTDVQYLPSNNSPVEPMEECPPGDMTSSKYPAKCSPDDVVMSENISTSSTGSMQVESSDASIASSSHNAEMTEDVVDKDINADDLCLLCDLFYLPFEHGNRALQLLNEFHWLKSNAVVLAATPPYKKGMAAASEKPEIQEWFQRAERFFNLSQLVITLAKKMANCANRELCYELFSYLWDIAGVVTLLKGFVKWLALGYFPATIVNFTQGSYTWFSKGWRETFSSGDQEPWVFRGGLTADLQRLIPVDSGNDLFLYKLPDTPCTAFPTIRPYTHLDEEQVYKICHKTCRDGSDCTELFPKNLQSIPADRLIGPFVTINPELCIVVESGSGNDELIGYACAALDAKQFYRNQEMCWLPAMCLKYPLLLLDSPPDELTQTAMDSINHFHNFKYDCPQDVLNTHPSIMTCCVLKEQFANDQSVAKRLVTVLLAALRSNGSSGVHACINTTDQFMHQFYSKLGFGEVYRDTNAKVYLGRNF